MALYSREFIALPIALFGAAMIMVLNAADILSLLPLDRMYPLMLNAIMVGIIADIIIKYTHLSSGMRLLVALAVLALVVIMGVAGKAYILPVNRLLHI